MERNDRGFTLIELLIVVAIIGIIAAIAIPNLMSALDKTRQRATMADMKQISYAVEQYSIELQHYPEESGDINGNLDQHIEPLYIKRCPDEDGWSNPMQYASTGSTYTLLSYGKNGQSDPLINGGQGGASSNFNDDIVFVDGSFVQWPSGQQQ